MAIFWSLEKNWESQVTSRMRPSGQWARVSSCWVSPGARMRLKTERFATSGSDCVGADGSGIPARISNWLASVSSSVGLGPGARAVIHSAKVR